MAKENVKSLRVSTTGEFTGTVVHRSRISKSRRVWESLIYLRNSSMGEIYPTWSWKRHSCSLVSMDKAKSKNISSNAASASKQRVGLTMREGYGFHVMFDNSPQPEALAALLKGRTGWIGCGSLTCKQCGTYHILIYNLGYWGTD